MNGVHDGRPLFHQAWWLDAVAPGTWADVDLDGEAHLAWQLVRGKRGTVVTTPPLTRLGPWIRPGTGSYASQLGREKRLMNQLLAALPAADLCQLVFPPEVRNWLPFHWAGFTCSARITYVLDGLTTEEDAWSRCTDKTRNAVRRAQSKAEVVREGSADSLVELVTQSLSRQDAEPLDPSLVRRVHQATIEHDAGRCLVARDEAGTALAAALVVWDGTSASYLLAGASEEGRTAGAQSAVLWEAIRCSIGRVERFDFEGSMLEPVEPVFRGFGGRQAPYLVVERMSRRYRAARALRDLVKASRS